MASSAPVVLDAAQRPLPAGFLPRVGIRSHRVVEQALTSMTLFDSGVELTGAIVEADWATGDPPLLARLRERGIPYLIDLHTLRFADPAFRLVGRLRALPYAPERALDPSGTAVDRFVHDALSFQVSVGAGAYIAPGVPCSDDDWWGLNERLLQAAVAMVGTEVPPAPLCAQVAPSVGQLAAGDEIAGQLADLPIAAVYVQPTRLLPTHQGLETLVRYVRFLLHLVDAGLGVIGGRVGTFGLLLIGLGIDGYDCDLGDAERFDLASLHASARRSKRQRERGEGRGGGSQRRLYLEGLKTTLISRHANPLIEQPGIRARFACDRGTCRLAGFDGLIDRARDHYLHTKVSETAVLRAAPTVTLRLDGLQRDLQTASDHAQVVKRFLEDRRIARPPSFEHLERWRSVLSRLSGLLSAA